LTAARAKFVADRSLPAGGRIVLAQFLKPFEEWGVYGASTTLSRATGGTDSTSFNQAGRRDGRIADTIDTAARRITRISTRMNASCRT
jgi:hypothetical protein